MNLNPMTKSLPVRVALALAVILVVWLAVELWPDDEGPAPVGAGQCAGLQCAYVADTEKALQAQDQLPVK